jgi:hypothetical protein
MSSAPSTLLSATRILRRSARIAAIAARNGCSPILTRVQLFEKGTEDIAYCPIEGDIIVNYYLMCELVSNDNVLTSISFAYGSRDNYFDLYEYDQLAQIKTLTDAEAYQVAKDQGPKPDMECRLSQLMKVDESDPFFTEWMAFHKKKYYYLYDESD